MACAAFGWPTIIGFATHTATSVAMGVIGLAFIASLPPGRTLLVALSYALASYPVVVVFVMTWANPLFVQRTTIVPMTIAHAVPGTFMLDRDGRVTSRFFEDFYIERNTVSSLMLKLGVGTAPVNATTISTAHLEATTYPSDAAIAPGNRITLTLDIVPRSGMHVYAPGASGYRVIALDIEPQPFVRALPTTYPASEIYFFAPLKERVPVFQKPFKLLRDVVIEGTPQAQAALKGKDAITITGRLEYQACDDKVCFNPASLPLTWTMSLRPLIRERPPVPQR